jgi:hypothetical protein
LSTTTSTQAPNSTPTPTPTSNAETKLTQTPTLRVWLRHPSLDETWISGSTKIIEWGTTYGAGCLTAKIEISKTGTTGDWTTLAENLTNINYFIWKVPNLDANDNYFICVTIADSSTPKNTVSDIAPIKIANSAENQLMSGFLFISGIVTLFFALSSKQVIRILKIRRIKVSQTKAVKDPTFRSHLDRIKHYLHKFSFEPKGEIND